MPGLKGRCLGLPPPVSSGQQTVARTLSQNYFDTGLTDYYYWIGVKRAAATEPFQFAADPPELPQHPSSTPYAHWSWYHQIANRTANYDCVIAQAAFKYEQFVGSGPSQQADPRYYNTDPANKQLAYGWNAYPCAARLHFVCEAPASAFPCFPPPRPPRAPGAPPPPPSPPRPQAGSGGGGTGFGDCESTAATALSSLPCWCARRLWSAKQLLQEGGRSLITCTLFALHRRACQQCDVRLQRPGHHVLQLHGQEGQL